MSKLSIENPANGQVLRAIDADDAASIGKKAARARAAQPAWAQRPLEQRIACLRAFRDLMAQDRADLAAITSSEVGKPVKQASNELNALSARIDFFLEQVSGVVARETVHSEAGLSEQIEHLPLGVIANISAWNYPYFVGANVFVPALLTGNAVLYKPSEHATLTGLAMTERLHAAGVPADVFQAIVGGGEAGASLLEQPVDGVFFTGSYATGQKVAQAAGRRMVHVQLELGGKDPAYVTDDVDPAVAAAATADGAFYNTGQSCCAVERIYVHQAVYEPFLEAFKREVSGFVVGSPSDEQTYIGPLTRAPQLAVLEDQVADALARGAKLELGGKRLDRPGHWFAPTVLTQVDHTMKVMRDESFGPIIGIQRVSSDEEATRLMNDTEYGLTAAVYCRDAKRAEAVLSQVDAGSAYVNCCDRVSPRLPWSGRGHSGLGLTLSKYGILTFTRPKAWHLRA